MDSKRKKEISLLRKYIETCIKDAFQAYHREGTAQYQFLLIDSTMALEVRATYGAVLQRLAYRINKNMKKNFGIDLIHVRQSNGSDIGDTRIAVLDYTYLGVGGTIAVSSLFDKEFSLEVLQADSPLAKYRPHFGFDAANLRLAHYFQAHASLPLHLTQENWELHQKLYADFLGHQPPQPNIYQSPIYKVAFGKAGATKT